MSGNIIIKFFDTLDYVTIKGTVLALLHVCVRKHLLRFQWDPRPSGQTHSSSKFRVDWMVKEAAKLRIYLCLLKVFELCHFGIQFQLMESKVGYLNNECETACKYSFTWKNFILISLPLDYHWFRQIFLLKRFNVAKYKVNEIYWRITSYLDVVEKLAWDCIEEDK